MSRRRNRDVTPDERNLWRRTVGDAARMERGAALPPAKTATKRRLSDTSRMPDGVGEPATPAPGIGKASAKGGKAPAPIDKRPKVLPPSYTPPRSTPAASDNAVFQPRERRRLTRGQSDPQARLDLHGMTQEAAHDALTSFVLTARARGHRTVLVITGKGQDVGTPVRLQPNEGRGVLKRSVPRWLAGPGLSIHVAGWETAGPRHGGGGALYVRLRR